MCRCLFGLGLLLQLFLGCSAENIVAGEKQTKAQELESSLPTWCPRVCTRFRACPEQDCNCREDGCDCQRVDETCEQQCSASFGRFTDAGEACAAIGQRVQSCIDQITCSDLDGSDPCPTTAAERALCPDPADNDPNDAATGNADSTAGANGGSSNATPVACSDSYGAGGGTPAGVGARVTCEEGRDTCTDGHVYSWICAQDSQGQRACTCLVDLQATAGFVPSSADCPPLSAVNAGCAWALTQ